MKKVAITVQGVSPLLFRRYAPEEVLKLRSKEKKAKSLAATETPREEATRYLHADKKGPFIPANMLMACLINGGVYCRLDGKRQMSTGKSTVIPGFLSLLEPKFYIRPGEWEVDVQWANNEHGGKGMAVCVCRPRFDVWEFDATFTYDDQQVNEVQVRELFDTSLNRIGLGSFRPIRKGTFGRSVITHWAIVG